MRRTNCEEMPRAATPHVDRTQTARRRTQTARRRTHTVRRPARAPAAQVRRRRWSVLLASIVAVIVALSELTGSAGTSSAYPVPTAQSLAGMTVRQRIVAIASSQVGYRTTPAHSYCNKFSAYWHAGTAACPGDATAEEWCADFAAWAWRTAGVPLQYGYASGEINGGAVSFYEWAIAHGRWHPATTGYIAAPGDVAVYGLSLGADPSAAHVAIVTSDSSGQRGPDAINGDGDHTGFSVVEAASDEARADAGDASELAGYVSPV